MEGKFHHRAVNARLNFLAKVNFDGSYDTNICLYVDHNFTINEIHKEMKYLSLKSIPTGNIVLEEKIRFYIMTRKSSIRTYNKWFYVRVVKHLLIL